MHRSPLGAAVLSADAHGGMRARCSQLIIMKHFKPWEGMLLRTARPQPAPLVRHCRSPRVRHAGRPTIGIPRRVGCARCARPAANRAPLRLVAGYARPDRRSTRTAASCTRRSDSNSMKCDRERPGAHLRPVALTARTSTQPKHRTAASLLADTHALRLIIDAAHPAQRAPAARRLAATARRRWPASPRVRLLPLLLAAEEAAGRRQGGRKPAPCRCRLAALPPGPYGRRTASVQLRRGVG